MLETAKKNALGQRPISESVKRLPDWCKMKHNVTDECRCKVCRYLSLCCRAVEALPFLSFTSAKTRAVSVQCALQTSRLILIVVIEIPEEQVAHSHPTAVKGGIQL